MRCAMTSVPLPVSLQYPLEKENCRSDRRMNKAKVTFLRAPVCNVDLPSGFITSAKGEKHLAQ